MGLLSHICSQSFSQGLHIRKWDIQHHAFVLCTHFIWLLGGKNDAIMNGIAKTLATSAKQFIFFARKQFKRSPSSDIRMKKIIVAFILCCVSVLSYGQHLSFMGIPINGTITSFQSKLTQKGFKPSSSNKYLPLGVRKFEGYFTNKSADVIVFYNNQTKLVYMCRVIFDRIYNSKDDAREAFDAYKESLHAKYGELSLNSDMLDNEERNPDTFSWAVIKPPVEVGSQLLGFIELKIEEGEYASQYELWIDYTDATNQSKNEDVNNNDL